MNFQRNFLGQIPWGDSKFVVKLLILVFLIIYIFTSVITVSPGHFLAIIVILSLLLNYENNTVFDNEQILAKLENLSTKEYVPEYLYVDSDLIILFDNIKLDFYKYNPRAFVSSLKACDNLLKLRHQTEMELLPQPKVKNILVNFPENEEIPSNDVSKVRLLNGLQTFEAAEIQYHLCINYLHSFIITVPSNRVLHNKYDIILEKADILLKRNLDIIYHSYNDGRKLGEKELTEYHTQRPYNADSNAADDTDLTKSFNFI